MREVVAPGIYKARYYVLAVALATLVASVAVTAVLWESGETQTFADSNPLALAGYGGGGIPKDHFTSDVVFKMTMCYGFEEKASLRRRTSCSARTHTRRTRPLRLLRRW